MTSPSEGNNIPSKIGNLLDFQLANVGRPQILEVQNAYFSRIQKKVIQKNLNRLSGVKINLIMEFNAVNGWFALSLYRMGARIKWASNNRYFS